MKTFQIFLLILTLSSCVEMKYKRTERKNTIEAYEKFLRKYPNNNEYSFIASIKKDSLAYVKAKHINTIKAYEEYKLNYSNGKYIIDAKNSVEKLYFENAIQTNTKKSYHQYLLIYPKGQYSVEANDKIEDLCYDEAKISKTIYLYEMYLSLYPNGRYKIKASFALDELYYHQIIQTNTIESCNNYLKKFPNGKYYEQVVIRKKEMILLNIEKMSNASGVEKLAVNRWKQMNENSRKAFLQILCETYGLKYFWNIQFCHLLEKTKIDSLNNMRALKIFDYSSSHIV